MDAIYVNDTLSKRRHPNAITALATVRYRAIMHHFKLRMGFTKMLFRKYSYKKIKERMHEVTCCWNNSTNITNIQTSTYAVYGEP